MKKGVFLVPYFGKLPRYFDAFLKTCEYNKDFDWIIFTDDIRNYEIPQNVKIIKKAFSELKEDIQKKFDFEISLDRPYKLCDYKPAYGYIFEDYINDYRFWGHCDLDIIFGNLNKFITDEMLNKYDKLFCLGHMVLYKNTYENNRIFMQSIDNKLLYKDAFSTNNIVVFDETYGNKLNINTIFIRKGKNVYTEDLSLNFKIFPTKFVRTFFSYKDYLFKIEDYKKAIYIWNEGSLKRFFIDKEKKVISEEYLYAHFQGRNMKLSKKILKCDCFQFMPNRFLKLKYKEITLSNFNKIKKNGICLHYFERHLSNKKKKLKKYFK